MKGINNFIFEKLRINKHITPTRYLDHLTLDEVMSNYNGKLESDSTSFNKRSIKYLLNNQLIKKLNDEFDKLHNNQNLLDNFIDNIIEKFELHKYSDVYIKLSDTAWTNNYLLYIDGNGIVCISCGDTKITIEYNHNYKEFNFTENYVLKLAAYMIEYIIEL